MSGGGGVSLALESHGEAENLVVNWDPCTCLKCCEPLLQPVCLPCHHLFCMSCSKDALTSKNAGDPVNTLICPICTNQSTINLEDGIKCDPLAKYLVISSQEKAEVCANCDQIVVPMCYCETCQQPLCHACKESTHQARMFSAHSIVPLQESIGLRGPRTCPIHAQPYILFTSDTKTLACIACFRQAALSTRSHFVDVDLAYKSGIEKLEKVSNKLKNVQQNVRDDIIAQNRLRRDFSESFKTRRSELMNLCQEIVDTVWRIRDEMLGNMQKQEAEADLQLVSQVKQLTFSLPSIQLYLLCSSIFCSCADKLDFLQHSYDLIKRMNSVICDYQSLPKSGCMLPEDIHSSVKGELANAIQPLIGNSPKLLFPTLRTDSDLDFVTGLGSGTPSPHGSASGRRMKLNGAYINLPFSPISKYQLIVDLAGAFGEEFVKIDQPIKEMKHEMGDVSIHAQEMFRDITQRRCLVQSDKVKQLVLRCQNLELRLGNHTDKMGEIAPNLQNLWQEQLDRVRRQQLMYKQQVEISVQVKDDIRRVNQIVEKMQPFTETIARAVQYSNPRRCHPPDPAPMEQICLQIQTLEPDSQMRVDAIEKGEERRKEELRLRNQMGAHHIRDAKKLLKTTKEHRRTKGDKLIKMIGRDRSRGGTDPGLLSPGSRKSDRESKSPNMLGMDLILGSDDASSLDGSFDSSDRPQSANEIIHGPLSPNNPSTCSFGFSGNSVAGASVKLSRSHTLHVATNINYEDPIGCSSPKLSSSLPSENSLLDVIEDTPTAPMAIPLAPTTVPAPPTAVPTTLPSAPTTVPAPPTAVPSVPTPPTTVPTPPTTLPSAPTTLPSAPTTLPSAPTTLPSAPTTLPTAPTTVPTSPLPIPPVPHIPLVITPAKALPKGVANNIDWDPSAIGAREKVLESLKERVKRVDSDSPERETKLN